MIAPVNRQNIRLNAIRNLLSQVIHIDCFRDTSLLSCYTSFHSSDFVPRQKPSAKHVNHFGLFGNEVGFDLQQYFQYEKDHTAVSCCYPTANVPYVAAGGEDDFINGIQRKG
jgi:hypothetical protein